MAFYKKVYKKICQKWFPQAVAANGLISTDRLVKLMVNECTVHEADVKAVLAALKTVMADKMSAGYSVKLDGMGTFRYVAKCRKTGVDTADEVSVRQITGVKVAFTPERTSMVGGSHAMTRTLTDTVIEWIEWGKDLSKKGEAEGGNDTTGGNTSGNGNSGGNSGGSSGEGDDDMS